MFGALTPEALCTTLASLDIIIRPVPVTPLTISMLCPFVKVTFAFKTNELHENEPPE
jgi:hypothetical protein